MDKHRQVGNAVPPPLGAAIGREIRKVLKHKDLVDVKKDKIEPPHDNETSMEIESEQIKTESKDSEV